MTYTGEITRKKGYKYGNKEYPRLGIGNEYLVEKWGRLRLVEGRFEYLQRHDGYEDTIETAEYRKLQRRYLWLWWFTVKEYAYKLNVNQTIREDCLGTKYEAEDIWRFRGLNRIRH